MSDNYCPICNEVGPALVECRVCGRMKKPMGRSAPIEAANSYCDSDCKGYAEMPLPSGLWPGERYGESLGHFDWHEEVVR